MKTYEKLAALNKFGKVFVKHRRRIKFYSIDGCGKYIKTYRNKLPDIKNRLPDIQTFIKVDGFQEESTIRELKKASFNPSYAFLPTGGTCEIEFQYMGKSYFGYSKCSPEDRYNNRVGLSIALGRLLSNPDLKGII